MLGGDRFCQVGCLQPAVGNSVRLGSNLGDSNGCVAEINGYSGLGFAHLVEIGVDVREQVGAETAARGLLSRLVAALVVSPEMVSRQRAPSLLNDNNSSVSSNKSALVVLNQPFSFGPCRKSARPLPQAGTAVQTMSRTDCTTCSPVNWKT